MSGVGKPAEDIAVPVERHDEAHIHQMRAAEIGIVDDVDVAGFRRQATAVGDHLDHRFGRILHDADEDRQTLAALRDQRAVDGRVDAVRAVIGLGDDRREGGAGKRQIHFITDLLQGGLQHRKRDRVELCHIKPRRCR